MSCAPAIRSRSSPLLQKRLFVQQGFASTHQGHVQPTAPAASPPLMSPSPCYSSTSSPLGVSPPPNHQPAHTLTYYAPPPAHPPATWLNRRCLVASRCARWSSCAAPTASPPRCWGTTRSCCPATRRGGSTRRRCAHVAVLQPPMLVGSFVLACHVMVAQPGAGAYAALAPRCADLHFACVIILAAAACRVSRALMRLLVNWSRAGCRVLYVCACARALAWAVVEVGSGVCCLGLV